MSEDAWYLLACYLIYGLTLAALVYRSKERRRTLLLNGIILVAYSLPLLYGLNFRGSDGTSLVWLVYLMFAIAAHWLANVIEFLMTFGRKHSARV